MATGRTCWARRISNLPTRQMSKHATRRLKAPHSTLTVGDESPWPGGEANGLGNARPDTPFTKWGTALTRRGIRRQRSTQRTCTSACRPPGPNQEASLSLPDDRLVGWERQPQRRWRRRRSSTRHQRTLCRSAGRGSRSRWVSSLRCGQVVPERAPLPWALLQRRRSRCGRLFGTPGFACTMVRVVVKRFVLLFALLMLAARGLPARCGSRGIFLLERRFGLLAARGRL
jgi:hypothetical protein